MVYTTQLCNLETTSLWFIPPIYVINRPIFLWFIPPNGDLGDGLLLLFYSHYPHFCYWWSVVVCNARSFNQLSWRITLGISYVVVQQLCSPKACC